VVQGIWNERPFSHKVVAWHGGAHTSYVWTAGEDGTIVRCELADRRASSSRSGAQLVRVSGSLGMLGMYLFSRTCGVYDTAPLPHEYVRE
jgi:hypothetical protein